GGVAAEDVPGSGFFDDGGVEVRVIGGCNHEICAFELSGGKPFGDDLAVPLVDRVLDLLADLGSDHRDLGSRIEESAHAARSDGPAAHHNAAAALNGKT